MKVVFQGNLAPRSSFSLINHRLVAGLRRAGHSVTAFDVEGEGAPSTTLEPPDVYLFHGYPFDLVSAPGRRNVFLINLEYPTLAEEERELVPRLNDWFDMVCAPSRFVADALRRHGLRRPIRIVPWGFAPREFRPSAAPVSLPTAGRFVFAHVGAVNWRKGTDLLLAAYREEFRPDEAVALVIKESVQHATWRAWAERILAPDPKGPLVIHDRGESESVAGWFTAADVGVFPHRGEGFGLPILECLASGRTVITTKATGPLDFCTPENAILVPARRDRSGERDHFEPDLRELRRALRRAFETERSPGRSRALRQSVSAWTWNHTMRALNTVLGELRRPVRIPRSNEPLGRVPRTAYAYCEKGTTSWRLISSEVDDSLRQAFPGHLAHGRRDRFKLRVRDLVVGASEHALEAFLRYGEVNGRLLRILHQEGSVLRERLRILNRERRLCGLPPRLMPPIAFWRNDLEHRLARRIVVPSSVAKRQFLNHGYASDRIRVVPLGIDVERPLVRQGRRTLRFLFVGTDSFRKGIRLLLEAWERARLPRAELVCLVESEAAGCETVLRSVVRMPNITLRPLLPRSQFRRFYEEIDCQVLPSLEDTFSLVVAEGMGLGKPALVSTETGVQDLLQNGRNGWIVKAGSVEALSQGLRRVHAAQDDLPAIGEAAFETARQYSWARFRQTFAQLIQEEWDEWRSGPQAR